MKAVSRLFFVLLTAFFHDAVFAQETLQINPHVADVKINFQKIKTGSTIETHYHPGDIVLLCLHARTKNKKESDFVGADSKNKSDKNHCSWKDFSIQVKGGTYENGAVKINKDDARFFTQHYLVVTAKANNDPTIVSSDSMKIFFDGNLLADFSGADGANGMEGSRGVSIIGREGIDGDSGGDGMEGSAGANIDVYVCAIQVDGVPHLQVCIQNTITNSKKYYFINANFGTLLVHASGGKGGMGGSGKRGSGGKDARDENEKKSGREAGNGGNGGDGGNGGNGGVGGTIHVFADSSALPFLGRIQFENYGGQGGDAGQGGSGGLGGSASTTFPSGKNGNDGTSGIPGVMGAKGTAIEIKIMKVERIW